ncbi:MAG: helix-turn-helix domain-containing protein [Clostridia bacterium]|nr:helix-turn-helix domain-containing protein [Clostridia bacterium]
MSGNFFTMENAIFNCGLSPYEFMVYSYLCMKADRKTKTCYPAAAKISADCNISISQVRKVTASLEEKGFITKEMRYRKTNNGKNHQTSNLYHIEPLPIQYGGTPSILNTHSLSDKEGK